MAAPPPAPVAAAKPAPAMLPPTPEQELERIAALRRDGKHEEADKALAEFRKRYPDYKLSDALRERVERR
jgi:TolA-binding protein